MAIRLTLITAPSGSGKAALLDDWAAQSSWSVAVLRFEDQHRDPEIFARELIRTVRQLAPDQIEDAGPDGSSEMICTSIINGLATSPTDMGLVIEGYDPNQACDNLLTFLLEYLPPQLHLFISSSEPPAISSLPRMRVRRQLNEITPRDFTLTAARVSE